MLRLFTEQEANERAFTALTRFLDALDDLGHGTVPAVDPLVLAFQLKLLWVSGYLPHLGGCVECGASDDLVGYLPGAGGAVCRDCATPAAISLAPGAIAGIEGLLRAPLAEAALVHLTERDARAALAVVGASYEFHGGFRLRTASA
jgi:DNA repair protein RecO (recombination protein O)